MSLSGDDLPQLEDIFVEVTKQAERAKIEDKSLGSFTRKSNPFASVIITDLSPERDEPLAPNDATAGTSTRGKDKPKVHWIQISNAETTPNMRHVSSNPLDFMTEDQANECDAALKDEDHKLGKYKVLLVDPGYKILIKVVGAQCPDERKPAGALTSYSFIKEKYDWHLVALTKEAYQVIAPLRALLDPRSGVLLLLRPYDTMPNATQRFVYEGIITTRDKAEDAKTQAKDEFREQADRAFGQYNIHVGLITDTPTTKQPNQVTVELIFRNSEEAITITPKQLPRTFEAYDGPRRINAYWPQTCFTCLSEAHRGPAKDCPWLKHEVGGRGVDPWGAKSLFPGQSTRPKKRKWNEVEQETLLTDLRPEAPSAKRPRTSE